MSKCTYNFNGESVTGTTPEECAKLKVRFKKAKERMERQFDSVAGRSRTKTKETPKPPKKKRNFLNKIGKKLGIKKKTEEQKKRIKQNKANQKKAKNIRSSRRKGLDRNARN